MSKSYFESKYIYEILNMGKTALRMDAVDKLVISLREEKNFEKMLRFCQKLTENFDL